jgi:cytochrome c oxidase subunit 2
MDGRNVAVAITSATLLIASLVTGAAVLLAKSRDGGERVITIEVRRFEYMPKEVALEKGVPVVLQLVSRDVPHGFNLPDLNVRADVIPGKPARVRIVPQRIGRFVFHCDIFCGSGHEDLEGAVVVRERSGG